MVQFTLFFLSLSLLIILHEFGHFIAARAFKTKVNKFYLFFDFLFPFSNLLKFSLFKKKIGDTEYGLGWFPFGGYVDIEGMGAEADEKPDHVPAPHEFRAKKPWQRLIILAGGVTVNYLLAIVIYSMMIFTWGETTLPGKNVPNGMAVDSLAMKYGFRDGDKILALDGKPVENALAISGDIILDDVRKVDVDRNGQKLTITLPEDFDEQFIGEGRRSLFDPFIPFVIDSVIGGEPAGMAGIRADDSLVSVDGDTLQYFQQFARYFERSKEKTVKVGVERDGQLMTFDVKVNKDGKIGAYPMPMGRYLKFETVESGFFASWGAGLAHTNGQLVKYVKQMRFLFTKEGASKIGGFGTIGSLYPTGWDWQAFWSITAMLSVILAFMNMLPIPVLDGGYILFVLWEMVTGKKVSDKFMQRALQIGMYIVLALLIFANGNDIIRAFRD